MSGVIYCILNTKSDSVYVGSTITPAVRQNTHFRQLSQGSHHNPHLQAAWNKYGEGCFLFEILEEVKDESQLTSREQYWIDQFQMQEVPLYNAVLIVSPDYDTESDSLTQTALTKRNRARELALLDLGPGRTPDQEIADKMGLSRSTICRTRKTKEYQEIIQELTKIDDLTVARVRGRIKQAFENLLNSLDSMIGGEETSMSEVVSALKLMAQFQPALIQHEPGTQLALPTQEFHPATVLIQNAYFGQQQGEVVEGEAKVLTEHHTDA